MNSCRRFASPKLTRKWCLNSMSKYGTISSKGSPRTIEYYPSLVLQNKRFKFDTVSNPTYRELFRFDDTFPVFLTELCDNEILKQVPPVMEPYKEVLEYNLSEGRHFRAMILLYLYHELSANPSEMNDDNTKKVYALAWCAEMQNAFMQLYDDMIDDAELRRGKLSLCRKVGDMNVVHQIDFVRESIGILLNKYFSDDKNYLAYSRMFREATVRMEIGLLQEVVFENEKAEKSARRVALNKYTLDLYQEIAYNKTGYGTYYLPMTTALMVAGKLDSDKRDIAKSLAVCLGNLCQARKDYLDVYGDSKRTGRLGTDIRSGTCSWLVVKALERCTPAQREIIQMNYGHPGRDGRGEQVVKSVFDELDLENTYLTYEDECTKSIANEIERCTDENFRTAMIRILESTIAEDEL